MTTENVAALSEQEFAEAMVPLGPFEPKPHLAVAFSGGADSTALVLLAKRWATRRGGAITALTVDHGLRRESAAEARLSQERIKALGIEGAVLRWRDSKPRTGIQNAARDARYGLMLDWCRRKGVLHLLLAHHQEDQAETILHRLGRQTGADGLAGMARIRETADVRLLRPCLNISRERLRAVPESQGISWIEDPSNSDPAFARVRLRNLLPTLAVEQISPTSLSGTARRLAEVRQSMENQVALMLAKSAALSSLGFARVDCAAVLKTEREIARRVLERLLGTIGGEPYPPRHHAMDKLLNDIRGNSNFGGRTLSGCKILPEKGSYLIVREAARCPEVKMTPNVWLDWDNRFRMKVSVGRNSERPSYVMRALGDGFPRKLAKKHKINGLNSQNLAVRRALPSLWDRHGLVSVPHLGYGRGARNPASVAKIQVEFIPNRPVTNAIFPVV